MIKNVLISGGAGYICLQVVEILIKNKIRYTCCNFKKD